MTHFSIEDLHCYTKERKGKWTCIAPIVITSTTRSSDVDHTELPANAPHLHAFPSYKHSLEDDTAANSFIHPATDILLIPRPTEGRRLSWPSWLTHSGRLAHEVVTRQPCIGRGLAPDNSWPR